MGEGRRLGRGLVLGAALSSGAIKIERSLGETNEYFLSVPNANHITKRFRKHEVWSYVRYVSCYCWRVLNSIFGFESLKSSKLVDFWRGGGGGGGGGGRRIRWLNHPVSWTQLAALSVSQSSRCPFTHWERLSRLPRQTVSRLNWVHWSAAYSPARIKLSWENEVYCNWRNDTV